MRRAALLAAVALATCVPSAAAHGGGGTRYRSAVTRVAPATPGLSVRVVQGDDQLELTNQTRATVIVIGYQGEPYLRFRAGGGVDVNARSPASTLNINRYGDVTLPPDADPKAPPRWQQIRSGSSYSWHDHRIHWMSTIDPPVVRNARGSSHHIFDWSVPLRIDGREARVDGTLDYRPAARTNPLWLIAPIVALVGGVALFVFTSPRFKARRGRRPKRPRTRPS